MSHQAVHPCIALTSGRDRPEPCVGETLLNVRGCGDQRQTIAEASAVMFTRIGSGMIGPLPDHQCLHDPAQADARCHPDVISGGSIQTSRCSCQMLARIAGEAKELRGVFCLHEFMHQYDVQDCFPLPDMEIVDTRAASAARKPPMQQHPGCRRQVMHQTRAVVGGWRAIQFDQQLACRVLECGMQRWGGCVHARARFRSADK